MKLDVKLINPFISATVNALEMMAMTKPERKGISLKESNTVIGDISGVMGLSGDVAGSIVVSFTEQAACKAVGKMLGTEYSEINDEITDGIQEIVNLIAGQAKALLEGTEYHFKIGLPTCIQGKNHQIAHEKGIPCVVAEFDFEGDPFTVEVSISPKK